MNRKTVRFKVNYWKRRQSVHVHVQFDLLHEMSYEYKNPDGLKHNIK